MLGDHDRLVQALTNLVSNAVKFSPEGEEVMLVARTDDDGVRLEVRDRGRGIPPEHLESIFDRFEQVDASDARELGGTGLGLTIARSIVDQHGGRIWAESTLGEGATFVIALPRAAHRGERAADADRAAGGARHRRRRRGARALARDARARRATGRRRSSIPGPFTAVLVAGDPVDAAGPLAALRARPQTAGVPLVFVGRQNDDELSRRSRRPSPRSSRTACSSSRTTPTSAACSPACSSATARRSRSPAPAARRSSASTATAPDLLLLDLVLPEGDGFGVVDHLRGDEAAAADPARRLHRGRPRRRPTASACSSAARGS